VFGVDEYDSQFFDHPTIATEANSRIKVKCLLEEYNSTLHFFVKPANEKILKVLYGNCANQILRR